MKNYLDDLIDLDNLKDNEKRYSKKNYLKDDDNLTELSRDYNNVLEKGIDIFEKLPNEIFELDEPISNFLKIFQKEFNKWSKQIDYQQVLPKLTLQYEEKSKVIYWILSNLRIYFSFEEHEQDNNYGIIGNDKENKKFFTQSGLLKKEKYSLIINEMIEYVIKNI